MMAVRDVVEQEIKAIERSLIVHPERYSAEGRDYWTGNLSALKWVLKTIDEASQGLATKVNESG